MMPRRYSCGSRFFLLRIRQTRPKQADIQPSTQDGPKQRGQNVNGEETCPATGDRNAAPTCEKGEQARPEITRRVETRLGQRSDHGNEYGYVESDKNGRQATGRCREVALVRDGKYN